MDFWKQLPFLFPHEDRRHLFDGNPDYVADTAYRNGTLQGAYFMISARSVGLDCGPMGGFNAETLDQEFFPDGKTKSIFICGIGYGDDTKVRPRSPRLDFEEACEIL